MPTIYTIPTTSYSLYPEGAAPDQLAFVEPVPAAQAGVDSIAELRFTVNVQLLTNVRVTITPSRQALDPPHSVTPDGAQWDIDAASPPSVVFTRDQVPAGGPTISFKVGFTGSPPSVVAFIYRLEADQFTTAVEQAVQVTVA